MRSIALCSLALTTLVAAPAEAQRTPTQVIVVTPGHPSPPMGPPVVVVPGRPSPPTSPSLTSPPVVVVPGQPSRPTSPSPMGPPVVVLPGQPAPPMGPPVVLLPGQYPPPMGPPVVVLPGQPSPPPVVVAPRVEVGVELPVCPPHVPCPQQCPPGVPCPPPPCVCVTNVAIAPVPQQVVYQAPATAQPARVGTRAVYQPPAPGSAHVAYTGSFDGSRALHGGVLRFTGHIEDIWFIEGEFGGQGASTPAFTIGEFQATLGPRVAATLIPSVLRLYGALTTGIIIRAIGDRNTWGIWPLQLGGGLEVGSPLTDNWSIGAFVDFRGELRIPFERDPLSVGFRWSAGLAFMWF